MLNEMFSVQKTPKDKSNLDFEKRECSKTNKGKEKVEDESKKTGDN